MRVPVHSLIVLAAFGAGAAQAGTVIVTPADMVKTPTMNAWQMTNYRDVSTGHASTTLAEINGQNARNGKGSVEMSLTSGSGKADFVYNWGFVDGRTLGSLNGLRFDWYRAGGGSAPAHLAPALRLVYDMDGSAATAADRGYLVWEQAYNGATASDAWVSSDIMGGNFWQRQQSPGHTVEHYGTTLAEWIAGPRPGDADQLSASSAILGIEFGIGSGWNGSFRGYVDMLSVGFAGQGSTTFNFETAPPAGVPEPGSLALLGLGMLGLVAGRRRRG
ncbi:PEP-CTERM sorting domain-containing protein [Massilia niastensis]|uniref:PEP-CTERM sorting domain-containing protein n=1 Tax=Massilia niastensis TaxID=544911 RepID=UPI000367532C|nr:PEP-CTERM sorting domain-containing protein [Massilia niastensis]